MSIHGRASPLRCSGRGLKCRDQWKGMGRWIRLRRRRANRLEYQIRLVVRIHEQQGPPTSATFVLCEPEFAWHRDEDAVFRFRRDAYWRATQKTSINSLSCIGQIIPDVRLHARLLAFLYAGVKGQMYSLVWRSFLCVEILNQSRVGVQVRSR